MKNKPDKQQGQKDPASKDNNKNTDKARHQGFERWKNPEQNSMGNDVSSEIKIANSQGSMEGGDNKQWHMDQGNFDENEKKEFENK